MRRWLLLGCAMAVAVGAWFTIDRGPDQSVEHPTADRRPDGVAAAESLETIASAAAAREVSELGPFASTVVANVGLVGAASLQLRYVSDAGVTDSQGNWTAVVDVAYRLPGEQRVEVETGGVFGPVGDRIELLSLSGPHLPLWLAGAVTVVRRGKVTVVTDERPAVASRLATMSSRGVDDLEAVVGPVTGTIVVEVSDRTPLTDTLDQPGGSYDAVAAVTATADGSDSAGAPVRVYLNPPVFDALSRTGQQVVVTHEITHAATGVITLDMPLWLVEGFADHVALSNTDLDLQRTAGQILRLVRDGGPPKALPGPADFDSGSLDFGAMYEASWLACEAIVRLGGEDALVRLYHRVAAGSRLSVALRSVVGMSVDEFTRAWSESLVELADRRVSESGRG